MRAAPPGSVSFRSGQIAIAHPDLVPGQVIVFTGPLGVSGVNGITCFDSVFIPQHGALVGGQGEAGRELIFIADPGTIPNNFLNPGTKVSIGGTRGSCSGNAAYIVYDVVKLADPR